ncbi:MULTISPECIES: hypothetical protein [Bradyrhizobium]|uniref:hypothetical protein n=1 Tax=Bradyrhizobium TaxID=374 RepID=UPI001BAA1D40|nr:hypothetical protein [Bradyrhizobium liaoningense]MBR0987461.1 hypothetical protein [Bradyrhizobium liaoningense]
MAVAIVDAPAARCDETKDPSMMTVLSVSPPTTANEMLRNFKIAFDNELFLRDDFYRDENLRNFFAADRVAWSEVTRARTSGYVRSRLPISLFLIRGTIDAHWNVVPGAKRRADGTIDANVSADFVVQLFGNPMKVYDPSANDSWRHPTPLTEKTHPLGNLAVEYKFDRARSTASLNCRFNGNGTVNACSFGNAER